MTTSMRDKSSQDVISTSDLAWTYFNGKGADRPSRELVPRPSAPVEVRNATTIVIERRVLFRECLTRCLKMVSEHNVISFASVEDWLKVSETVNASLIVLCSGGRARDADTNRDITLLSQSSTPLPTILMSDFEDADQIVDALERGARGYIPTSVSLDVAIEAMRLVRAGGVFVPASSLIASRRSAAESAVTARQTGNGMFTARQSAVVEALRRGKANKIIAYELNMRESTVKVHVRNIMKKLRAKNRTEVAFMASGFLNGENG
jgi:DNA-binding NarL/FixJ family response regulator